MRFVAIMILTAIAWLVGTWISVRIINWLCDHGFWIGC